MTDTADTFSLIEHHTETGESYWYARELMVALEYDSWQKFKQLIERAIESSNKSDSPIQNHFIHVDNMVELGSGSVRKIEDYALSKYACYLIAMNGNPQKKKRVAQAQHYFAVQTRAREEEQKQLTADERITARKKLTETEKELSSTLYTQGLTGRQIGEVRASGDKALFGGFSTKQMKKKLGIKVYKPLADHLPTITLKAKDLAAEMTTHKVQLQKERASQKVKAMHVGHNTSVRTALTNEGIYPEELPAEVDIKQLEKKQQQLLSGKETAE